MGGGQAEEAMERANRPKPFGATHGSGVTKLFVYTLKGPTGSLDVYTKIQVSVPGHSFRRVFEWPSILLPVINTPNTI